MCKQKYWIQNRDTGCECTFCNGNMFFIDELASKSGPVVRALAPDEFQMIDVDKLWVVKNPKCLVKHPEFSYEAVMKKAKPWSGEFRQHYPCEWVDGPKINHHCKKCKTVNEFAEPNQEDGSYVCYECR